MEGPYLGLIRVAGFGNMEIIARHVLSPEELQRIAHCAGSDFTLSPLPEDLATVVALGPEHQVQGDQVSRVEYPG